MALSCLHITKEQVTITMVLSESPTSYGAQASSIELVVGMETLLAGILCNRALQMGVADRYRRRAGKPYRMRFSRSRQYRASIPEAEKLHMINQRSAGPVKCR
jgi:hypothetical protein